MALIKDEASGELYDNPNYHSSVLYSKLSVNDKNHLVELSKKYLRYPLRVYNNGYGFRAYIHINENPSATFKLGRRFEKN